MSTPTITNVTLESGMGSLNPDFRWHTEYDLSERHLCVGGRVKPAVSQKSKRENQIQSFR